jgi:OHCU decarboxylase
VSSNPWFEDEARGRPVRLRGGFTASAERGFAALSRTPVEAASRRLQACCGSRRWLAALIAGFPQPSARGLFAASEQAFDALGEADWREAFAAHPRIGDRAALKARAERDRAGAERERSEQAGTATADEATLAAFAAGNELYEERFGHVFLICASGRSASEMLAALRLRLSHDAATELAIAAEEQRKITVLRLERLLGEPESESS